VIDSLAHLLWREPLWLWLALCPWLLWSLRGFLGRPRGTDFADPQLMPWVRGRAGGRLQAKRFWRHAVLALAWLLFAMAMAGPRLAHIHHDQDRDDDTQLMVVLDVSRSMTARDIAPSRLQRARLELDDLVARQQRLKIGLVIYAARPHLMIPPTADKSVLRHALQRVRYGLLPTEGSNLPEAIEFAGSQFTSGRSARALLLVTDGEIPTPGAAAETALDDRVARLAQQGIAVYALGIGSREGAPLQAPQGGWLHYQDKPVVSRLQQDRLQRLAVLGNGRYARVADTDAEWRQLYDQDIRYLHAGNGRSTGDSLTEYHELYGWFLLPAALLLLLAYVEPRRASPATPALFCFMLLAVGASLHPLPAHADTTSWQQRAYQAYSQQAYQQAKQDYARVAGYAGRMGEGSSAYHLGEYRQAVQLFTQAILDADNDAQRARALFNLANSHYRLEDYGAALDLYREVLRYVPEHRAATSNLAFAMAMQQQQQQAGDDGGSGRQGRGPRSGRVPPGSDVISGRLSIDDEDKTVPPPVAPLAETPSPQGSDLIELGIYQARPVVQQITEFNDPAWHYATTSARRIVLQANGLKVDESIFWQRLFEAEEGFPAPVEAPRELQGIPPW